MRRFCITSHARSSVICGGTTTTRRVMAERACMKAP
jgi:glycerol-3-phosphate dehydrogenase